MNRRKFLSHSAVALSAGPSVLGAARSPANRPPCNYRIVYNDDGHTMQRVSGIKELLEKGGGPLYRDPGGCPVLVRW